MWKVKSGNGSNSLDQVDEMLELDLYKSLVGCQQNWEDAAILTAFFYDDKIVFANDLGNVYFFDCAFGMNSLNYYFIQLSFLSCSLHIIIISGKYLLVFKDNTLNSFNRG